MPHIQDSGPRPPHTDTLPRGHTDGSMVLGSARPGFYYKSCPTLSSFPLGGSRYRIVQYHCRTWTRPGYHCTDIYIFNSLLRIK